MIIAFDFLCLENHSHKIKRYAQYTSENVQGVFNILKCRKRINEDICIYNNTKQLD